MRNIKNLRFYILASFLIIFLGKVSAQQIQLPDNGIAMPTDYEYGVTDNTITTNGSFSNRGGAINPNAGVTTANNPATTVGTHYTDIGFWSQARRITNDEYENSQTYNIFSLMMGTKPLDWKFSSNLITFPGIIEKSKGAQI